MDIFNSQWLLKMLAKSSKTPHGRILSLFDILEDWIRAPNIQLEIIQNTNSNQNLITFLIEQAKACDVDSPETLVEQIVLIARKAAQNEINHPDSCSLAHAKAVAHALLLAHTQNDRFFSRVANYKPAATYSIAASLILLIGAVTIWMPEFINDTQHQISVAQSTISHTKNIIDAQYRYKETLTPRDAANMYEKYERMRNGICQYPEVLSIPDKDRAIYLENVVGGQLPKNSRDMAITNFYLEKVSCYYSPLLRANFTG